MPMIPLLSTAIRRTAITGNWWSCLSASDALYAPTAINAPWPSDSCPFSPVSRVSPAAATRRSKREETASISDLAEPLHREDAARPHHQHPDEDDQSPNGVEVGAKVAPDVTERKSHDEPADDRPYGAVESPEDRTGETKDEDVVHERRVEQQRGRDQDAGERPDQRRERPPQREHASDPDPEQARDFGVEGRGAHAQAQVRFLKEHQQQDHDGEDAAQGEEVER